MRFGIATTLRIVIAFAVGLLIDFWSNHRTDWPCGLAVLLSLLLGIIGILRIGEGSKSMRLAWLSTSYLVWFGLELPTLLHPQLMIIIVSGCFVGCDGGPNAVYPDQQVPATFLIAFIGFLIGLFAISMVVLTIAEIATGFRESRTGR